MEILVPVDMETIMAVGMGTITPVGMDFTEEFEGNAVTNPVPFIEAISLSGKTNFFERRVSEYSMANVGEHKVDFNINESF